MSKTVSGPAPATSTESAHEKTSYSWDEVRAELNLDERAVALHRAQLEFEVRAHSLAEIRRRQQITQQDLAQALGISQSRVSQIERQGIDEIVLSTLAAYVEALGGRVRVIADFGDEQGVLSRVTGGPVDEPRAGAAQEERRGIAEELRERYEAGTSLRTLAGESGLSYGFVHRILAEAGVIFRGGGSRRTSRSRTTPGR